MLYENIVKYCKEHDKSISQFEQECGLGNGVISQWQDDKSLPNLKTLNKIAEKTKVPVAKWLD
mgnify:CR=1 FL=1